MRPGERFFRTAPALVAALLACGGETGDGGAAPAPSIDVAGVEVVLATEAPFARAPDFPARFETTVAAALRYWGGTWSHVSGRSVTLVDDPTVPCGDARALGCFDQNLRLTTQDPGAGTIPCIEGSVLVHEIGHAVIGDPYHSDVRWMQMDELAAELGGRAGYDGAGITSCTPHVSVWRHPLNSP